MSEQQNKAIKYCTCNFIGKDNLCIHSEDCPFYNPQQNKKECKCEEDHNGNCYFCGRNMLVSPLTMEERFMKELNQYTIDFQFLTGKECTAMDINYWWLSKISSAVSQALKEERQFILNILDGIDMADHEMLNSGGGTKTIRQALESRFIK